MIDDIKKTLWATADKLRANMDAAEYKHLVLGLIFVKYISDTFHAKRAELTRRFADRPMSTFCPTARPRCWPANWKTATTTAKSMSSGCPRPRAGNRYAPPPSSPTSASVLTTRCR
jgi:type I restriction-modification system DNA methylase subunit